jgi:hypothetical protein
MIYPDIKEPYAKLILRNFATLTPAQRGRVRYWLRQQLNATLEHGHTYAPIFTSFLKK